MQQPQQNMQRSQQNMQQPGKMCSGFGKIRNNSDKTGKHPIKTRSDCSKTQGSPDKTSSDLTKQKAIPGRHVGDLVRSNPGKTCGNFFLERAAAAGCRGFLVPGPIACDVYLRPAARCFKHSPTASRQLKITRANNQNARRH